MKNKQKKKKKLFMGGKKICSRLNCIKFEYLYNIMTDFKHYSVGRFKTLFNGKQKFQDLYQHNDRFKMFNGKQADKLFNLLSLLNCQNIYSIIHIQ